MVIQLMTQANGVVIGLSLKRNNYMKQTMKLVNLIPLKEVDQDPTSNLLSLLASPEIKKYMDRLSDTLEDADFMRVKKLYDGLYTELKKHE